MTDSQSNQAKRNIPIFYYGYVIVLAAFFILLLVEGIHSTFGIFFTPLLTEFGLDRAATSGIASTTMLLTGLLGIVMGRMSDRLGPRLVLSVCGLLVGLSLLLMSRVTAIWHLYAIYGVMLGIGRSGVMVPLMSTVARWFTKQRSLMTGIVINGIGVGSLIFAPTAGRLIALYEWRTAYLIMGGIALVLILFFAQLLRRDPSKLKQSGVPAIETAKDTALLPDDGHSLKGAVSTGQFWLVIFMFFCIGFTRLTVIVHIVPYAIGTGMSPVSAANTLAVLGGMSIITTLGSGILGDRIGNRKMLMIGFLMTIVAYILLAVARADYMFFIVPVIFSLNWGVASCESPLVAGLFGLKAHGTIFGMMGLSYTIGAAAGPFIAGYLFDITDSYVIAFTLCIALSILAIIALRIVRPLHKNSTPLNIETQTL
jgi:MFS family permease